MHTYGSIGGLLRLIRDGKLSAVIRSFQFNYEGGSMPEPYTKYASVLKLVKSDAACVERHARYLFIVDEEGSPLALYWRENAPLNIVAVIGPAVWNGHAFSTSLLLEIGLGRARPYHDALAPPGYLPLGRAISKRRNYGFLGPDRFSALRPYLLDLLANHAEDVVSRWKHKTWNIPSYRSRVVKTGRIKEVVTRQKEVSHRRGARVSVSCQDTDLLGLFCGFDIERNKGIIETEARLLRHCLGGYAHTSHTDAKLALFARARSSKMRLLCESFGPKSGRECGRLLPHHVAHMYKHGLIPLIHRDLFEQCASLFHLVDMERVSFFESRDLPEKTMPFFVDVRVLPARRASADYIVFELIPHAKEVIHEWSSV